MWERNCDQCGKRYSFQRPQSRFCSSNCRAKNEGKPRSEESDEPHQKFFVSPNPETDPVHILQQRRKAKRSGDDQAYAYWMAKWNALPPSVVNPNPESW